MLPLSHLHFAVLSLTSSISTVAWSQWVAGGLFATTNHFQACAFHTPDTGLFVYGTDNPASGEGGLIRTDNGATTGGFYVWYTSPGNIEDIDVRIGVDGFPYYLAAGHAQYNQGLVIRQYPLYINPFQFDSVRTGPGKYYRAIRMRSDLVAFAAGGNAAGDGLIEMSVDTGATWTTVATLTGQPVSRLHFVDDLLGFASTGGYRRTLMNGVFLPDSGAIYRTVDGGWTWLQVHADASAGFSDVAFSTSINGAATRNDGVILHTADGGDTWQPAAVNLPGPYVMTSVTFRPDGTGFAGCYRTDGTAAFILISYDGGMSWYQNFSTAGFNHSRRLYDMYFFDDAHGYAPTHTRQLRSTGIVTQVPLPGSGAVLIYPNPFAGRLNVSLSAGPADLQVRDTLGRLVMERQAHGPLIELDLTSLPAGHYMVRARQQGVDMVGSVIRE
ncbi:MAG: T9SS type A sorting domain-containing protein [Flavobacteriales bacterium]|nr:T9SS type A sorting domain-containing protein [Flavobacteriales bacterium]